MFQLILLCFSLRLCIRKFYCVSKKIVVYQEISLCSEKDCGVLEKIVVFSKRLLCSLKDCCFSEEKLSCVLPLWATVLIAWLSQSDSFSFFLFSANQIAVFTLVYYSITEF